MIYPNPNTGTLNVQLSNYDSPNNEIKVLDMYGKLLDVVVDANDYSPVQTLQVDLSRYPDGVYFVQTPNSTVKKVLLAR
jgi:hypothetical protein